MADEQKAPYRIWATQCPFRKTGFPVVGSFGATVKPVIIISLATWQRLVADFPELGKAQFEVGEDA